MAERLQFWQAHLRTMSDVELCAVTARGLRRYDLLGLLEVVYERFHSGDASLKRRFRALRDLWYDKWFRFCVDCGIDVYEAGEYFMVHDPVWNSAWLGRNRPSPDDGQLCIGCLERRLGRTLMHCDFTDAPVNVEQSDRSDRLRDRLTTKTGTINGLDGLVAFAVEGMIAKLPEDRRAAARAAWEASGDNGPRP